MTSGITGTVAADPPRPDTEGNGLSENESATLWSRDADNYISQEAYRDRYGESRSALHQLANGTDITFKRPPDTAATWTRNDFEDLDAGSANTSVHPPNASLEDGRFIADAHATVFAVQPSTRAHLEPSETPLYVAPNGTVRGLVDYRVRVPNGSSEGNTTVDWSLADHGIEEIRIRTDNTTVATTNGSQTPSIDYRLAGDGEATLSIEAEIQVRLNKTVRIDRGNETEVNITYPTEELTVSDELAVEIYDLSAYPYYAEYPNGDTGVAVYQSRPWQGYTLTEAGTTSVRGVWRFYTARDTDWDTLVRTNRTASSTVESDALPVYVHAYPSRIGPRAEPVRGGPEIVETWGIERSSPTATIGENVHIEEVTDAYNTTYGVAVRAETVDRDALQVAGIVRGVNASIEEPQADSERQLRRSHLSIEVIEQNESHATLRLELRDRQTGEPITLNESPRGYPIIGDSRRGYITIADRRVETNRSGVAIVTIDQPGIYTARYQPGSWRDHDPAYVGETATVRWHPLRTIEGWFALLFEIGWQLLPFIVMFYAGTRLLRLLAPDDSFDNKL
nr:hypothetical protein [Halostella salina]